jgi:DNA-binding response OmpR family regulator
LFHLDSNWVNALPPPGEPASASSGFRVLVVEDEFLVAMELAAVLQDAGFEVVGPAATVAFALARIHAEPPHAAILDVSLRGERVTPVAEVLLALNVPFVLASAFEAADLADEPSLAGARNLGKPTSPATLIDAMAGFQAR